MQRMVGWVAVYPGLGLPGTRGHFGQTQPDGCYRDKDQVFFLLRSWAEGRCFAESKETKKSVPFPFFFEFFY